MLQQLLLLVWANRLGGVCGLVRGFVQWWMQLVDAARGCSCCNAVP